MVAALLYILCWGWMILFQEPVWDDWILLKRSASDLMLDPDPRMPVYAFFNLLPDPILWYSIATFICYFFSGLFFYALLKKSNLFPEGHDYWGLLLFWLLPLNVARISCINFPYSLSLCIFLAATYLFMEKRGTLSIISAAILFLISFMTPSLLVLFYAVWVLLFVHDYKLPTTSINNKIIYGIFFLLPILAWGIRSVYFQPEGVYTAYYAVKPENILVAPIHSLKVLFKNILESLQILSQHYLGLISIILTLLIFTLEKTKIITINTSLGLNTRLSRVVIPIGLFLLLAGIFPYVAIGKEPGFSDWLSRHQLLMTPGIVFIVLGMRYFLSGIVFRYFLFSLLIASFVMNLSFAWEWKKDKERFPQLMEQIIHTPIPDSICTVWIDMPSETGLARNRQIRFYEISGYMQTRKTNQAIGYFPVPPGIPEHWDSMRANLYFLGEYSPKHCDSMHISIR